MSTEPIETSRQAPRPSPKPETKVLGWAAFLASSWTWCIGMFLPVLLIRDYGVMGWLVFAIPNVVGAAAMGWTIVSRDHSLRFVTEHRKATLAFSYVTIAFHVFFILWKLSELLHPALAAIAFGLLLCVLLPLFVTNLAVTTLAMLTLGVSVAAVLMSSVAGGLHWPAKVSGEPLDVVGLALVCTMGFACSPYLDLTFHRARQECADPQQSRTAFGVGFGLLFLSMIVFTLFYATSFLDGSIWSNPLLRGVIAIHLLVQAMFTVGVHADALAGACSTRRQHSTRTTLLGVSIVGPALLALISLAMESRGVRYGPLSIGEVVYRLFMSFYGLLAPAYVWLCVWPGRGYRRPPPRALGVFAVASLVAVPFYFLGFIDLKMPMVIAGVAAILAGKFFLDRERRDLLREARSTIELGSYDPQHPPEKSSTSG